MDLLWPGFLILLLLIPIIIGIYLWMMRRRRKFTVRFSSLSLVRVALPQYSRVRRYLPMGLFLAALGALAIALSRPVTVVSVPTNQTTIILAMDVSRSMCSNDIEPNRLIAAEKAALSFIQNQKAGTQFGIVAFSGFAEVVQTPTLDQQALADAIQGLSTGRRTAIGSGILKSIDAIAEVDPSVAKSVTGRPTGAEPTPVPKGAYVPEIIVLLTDGANNAGPQPVDAAQQARDRGIRVYTIGFGTARGGEFPNCNPQQYGREPGSGLGGGFGGGFGGGGGRFRRGIDEDTLKKVAEMTDAKYYSAESSDELNEAFSSLPTNLITKTETTEISVVFVALGAMLAALGVSLSMLWHPLP